MKKPIEVIKKAKEKISNPGAWALGESARDKKNNPVRPDACTARRWCVGGALRIASENCINPFSSKGLMEVYRNDPTNDTHMFNTCSVLYPIFQTSKMKNYSTLHSFNDDPNITHGDVLEMLDEAIEICKGESRG